MPPSRAINGYESDLLCGPYYVGEADRHMPNHAGTMVVVKGDGFETVRDCYEYDSPYFAPIFRKRKGAGSALNSQTGVGREPARPRLSGGNSMRAVLTSIGSGEPCAWSWPSRWAQANLHP
jgi:hypothetical protein